MRDKPLAGLLAAMLLLQPMPVFAEESTAPGGTYHGLDWTLEEHVLTVSGSGSIYCCTSAFPNADAEEYPAWRAYADNIYEITIGEGVTGAQEHALSGYPNLTKITLPESFTALAPYALADNPQLADIAGLEHVTEYDFHCLSGTAFIDSTPFVIHDGRLCYAECTSLTVPEGVTDIMPYAFGNLTGGDFLSVGADGTTVVPVTVTLPEGVEVIHENAFAFCAGLRQINLPDSVREIGDHAFYNCASLESLRLGENVESVGTQAFFNCRSMQALAVANKDAVLGANAYGTVYDWETAIRSTERYTDEQRAAYLARLEADPICYDVEMTSFAVHFLNTRPYSDIDYRELPYAAEEDNLRSAGLLIGYEDSTAESFAVENAVAFHPFGDVNLDGTVDIMDVIALNKYLLGSAELEPAEALAADYNQTGSLEESDSLGILRCVVELE